MALAAFSRRELRRLFRGWARANARTLGVVVYGALILGIAATWYFASQGSLGALRWYVMGFIHAILIVVLPTAAFLMFLASHPQAIFQFRGAMGEENTRDTLKVARLRRLVWGWVDSIELAYGDIDHLVVTRRGGLVAIDSKWRNTINPSDPEEMARSAEKARLRANAVVDTVLRAGARGQRSSGHAVRIRPLVVIWRALQSEIPESANTHGVDFVPGYRLRRYLKDLQGDPIDREAASELLRRVRDFRDTSREQRAHVRR